MKIFTYYEDIWGHLQEDGSREGLPEKVYQERKLAELWKKNWEKHGFNAEILGLKDAKKHPDFDSIMSSLSINCKKIRREPCPSIKSKRLSKYGASCYHRWLAFAALNLQENFFVADYDVFATGLPSLPSNKENVGDFVSYQWATPSFVKGNSSAFEYFIKLLEDWSNNIEDCKKRHEIKNLSSVHDQDLIYMFAEEIYDYPRIKLVAPPSIISNYNAEEDLNLVTHLSHHSVLETFKDEYSVETVLKRRIELVNFLDLV